MSAIDWIHGSHSHEQKKYKFHDATWELTGSGWNHQLIMNGELQPGALVWEKSRYLRVGREINFFAFMSGSGVDKPHYKVFLDEKRVGYVPPRQFSHMMPLPAEDEDE